MDIAKLQGLIDAIEGESRAPAPSHNNLARLVASFCKELLIVINTPAPAAQEQSKAPASIELAVEPETPKKKSKAKK